MESDVEDEEHHRSPCVWLCLISLVVIGFIILIGGLIGLFVHFDPLKEVDLLPPETDLEFRKRRFYDVYIVSKRLNFTQAVDYCINNLDGALLAFPRSFQEEDRLEKDVTAQMDENGTEIMKKCGGRLFIGVRKSVDAQWVLADGSSALAMPKLHDIDSGDFDLCSKITYEDNNLDFSSTRCSGPVWNCIICEYICPDKSQNTCYTFWENVQFREYDEAMMFCKNSMPRGNLASINHTSVLKTLEMQIKSDATFCESFGVGNHMRNQYESADEEAVPYKSVRIINMRKMKSDKSCVSLNLKKALRWELTDCFNPRCFVCVRENTAVDDSRSKHLPIEYD